MTAETYPLRVLVCGGWDYTDGWRVGEVLSGLNIAVIAHGNAKGADRLAAWWAASNGVPCHAYPADWRPDGKFDRGAGPRRNRLMLDDFQPDLVVAFPGGRGTAHMMYIARTAGVEVHEVGAIEGAVK